MTCNCNTDCCEDQPINAIQQAVNDAMADRFTELQGYVDSSKENADASAVSETNAAESATEAKGYRDQTETIYQDAQALVPEILEASQNVEDAANAVQNAVEIASSVAIVRYPYTVVGGEDTIVVPTQYDARSVQSIDVEGFRQYPGHGYSYDASTQTVTMDAPFDTEQAGTVVMLFLGTLNADSPETVYSNLASASGATLIGTAGNITVQEALDNADASITSQGEAITELQNDLSGLTAEGVATTHRGTVAEDLDTIDRRPDGYANDPNTVLANGQDVQINTNLSLTSPILPGDYQVIQGVGGSLTMTAIARAVSIANKKGVRVNALRVIGSVVNGESSGNVAYACVAEDASNLTINGIDATGFTGAVELLRTTDFVIRDVYARNMRYHSDVAAGGYGVLLEGCKRGLVDGINFRAATADGDLGRHAVYISVDSNGNFCEDLIVRNLIATYVDIDNRDMPGAVVRRSNRCMIEDFNINGANSGIGLNASNGTIQDFQIRNGHMKIIQYDDNAVYGISGGVDSTPATVIGLRVDNVTVELELKSGVTPTTVRLHALNMTCRDSYFTNLRFKSHGSANPILVPDGAMNLAFDGLKDFVTAGTASSAALMRFQGNNSNIKVLNIDTARTPFVGLDNVTNLTVNWERYARIVSNNGTLTLTDGNSLISSVAYGTGTGEIVVVFKNHVTTDAVRNATVSPASVAGLTCLPEISGRTMTLRFYGPTGALVTLSAAIVSADIRLHS